MPLTPYGVQQMLDWISGAAAATQPPGRWLQFATASPTSQSAFDGPFSPRQTVTFAGANSPQMSVTNLNTLQSVSATAIGTAVGWNIYDRSSGGTRIAYGTCTASIGCASADSIRISPGGLKVTLS